MNTTTSTQSFFKTTAKRRWSRYTLFALGIVVLAIIGALIAFIPYATENQALKNALEHVESGAIPDEPAEFARTINSAQDEPTAQLTAGSFSSLAKVNNVTYNAAITLNADNTYDYLLTVGNSRVFKLYKHSGRWWVKGRVLHTVMLDGDQFLTAPAARDRKTPAHELIIESTPDHLVLQAHYGQPVQFDKAQ